MRATQRTPSRCPKKEVGASSATVNTKEDNGHEDPTGLQPKGLRSALLAGASAFDFLLLGKNEKQTTAEREQDTGAPDAS